MVFSPYNFLFLFLVFTCGCFSELESDSGLWHVELVGVFAIKDYFGQSLCLCVVNPLKLVIMLDIE